MTIRRVALRPARAAVRSSRDILNDEAERTIDGILDSSLPEAVGRRLAQHQVLERVATEFVETTAADPNTEKLEQLVDRLVQSTLHSDAFRTSLYEIVASAELRRAIEHQTAELGSQVAAVARTRLAAGEDVLEHRTRHLLHLDAPPAELQKPGGVGTRGAALVVDVLLAQLLFLIGTVSVALVWSLVARLTSGPAEWSALGGGWLLVAGSYFVGFWATAGQTPGLRLMRLRVVTRDGAPLSLGRACVRFVGLILAILPLLAGFLPVLVDRRRRALQDFVAGTVVVFEEAA